MLKVPATFLRAAPQCGSVSSNFARRRAQVHMFMAGAVPHSDRTVRIRCCPGACPSRFTAGALNTLSILLRWAKVALEETLLLQIMLVQVYLTLQK